MRRWSSILLLVLAAVAGALAQPLWSEFNGVAGFTTIREGAGGALFAIRGDGVVYTSTDRGLRWRTGAVLGGSISSLFARGERQIVARIDPRATNFYQIHLSTDNGVTWTRVTTSNNANRQLMGFDDAGQVYAYFRDSFFGLPSGPFYLLRYDGAGGWPVTGVPLPVTASASPNVVSAHVIDHSGTILVGVSRAGLYVTRDQGATWENQFAGRGITALSVTPSNHIYLAADPTVADGGVYVSDDGAQSWSYLGFSDKRVSSVVADSAGNVLVSTTDGFYRLAPGSDTWDYASPFSELFDVMVATGGNTVLVSSGTWGQFRSTDGGDTWVQSGPRKRDVYALLSTPSGTTIAGTSGARTFRSTDEGANWSQALDGQICDNVFALAEHAGTVFAGTECGLYRSTDEGASWARATDDVLDGPVGSVAIDRAGGGAYAGTLFGVARSVDGVGNWERSGLGGHHVIGVATGDGGLVVALTASAGVFTSSDAGNAWTPRGLVRDDVRSLHVDAAGTILVGLFGGVARSTDGGAQWTVSSFTDSYVDHITSLGTQSVYAACAKGIFASFDEGVHWAALDASGLAATHVISMTFDTHGVLFAGTYNGGVYRTSRTLTGVDDAPVVALPTAFALRQNYPNPFNPSTTVDFDVPTRTEVRVVVYDLLGRAVATLADGVLEPGTHHVRWEAQGAPGGVYFVRMTTPSEVATRKMLLVK